MFWYDFVGKNGRESTKHIPTTNNMRFFILKIKINRIKKKAKLNKIERQIKNIGQSLVDFYFILFLFLKYFLHIFIIRVSETHFWFKYTTLVQS